MAISELEPPRQKQAKRRSRRQHRPTPALPAILHDSQVLTFRQWIALNSISARTGRRIIAAPGGPIVTRLSPRRIGITIGNDRAWKATRAQSAIQLEPPPQLRRRM